jgi:ABC-type multidrug transport system ATPase subunit
MQLQLNNVGKRFGSDWIFRAVDLKIEENEAYAILGPNGSGKSTLLKVLCGHLTPSKGEITFTKDTKKIDIDAVYRSISYAAPYIELIEELTLKEAIDFHQKFTPFLQGIDNESIISLLAFDRAANKLVRHFSSGMKQRLKLALAICSDTSLLLLDEPTTNLDKQGEAWYRDLLTCYGGRRTVVIATNVIEDYAFFCNNTLNILDYKQKR